MSKSVLRFGEHLLSQHQDELEEEPQPDASTGAAPSASSAPLSVKKLDRRHVPGFEALLPRIMQLIDELRAEGELDQPS